MKIGFLITARLKSSRLRLKLLKPLNGRTVIERVIDRAKTVIECDEVVLCTSKSNQDLPLVRTAINNNIYYYNGSDDDVLLRLSDAAELFNLDYFVGITGDNPLFSTYHANLLSDIIRSNPDLDFVYTTGMPIGVNIYAVKTKALKTVCTFKEELDTEIWGYLVNRPDIFNVLEVPVEKDYVFDTVSRISLDYIEDYKFFSEVFNSFPSSEIVDILDVFKLINDNPELASINKHIKQLDLDESVKKRIEVFFLENKDLIKQIKDEIYCK
jgi:spore coat polysaccharide biosynthesis protein SpsF